MIDVFHILTLSILADLFLLPSFTSHEFYYLFNRYHYVFNNFLLNFCFKNGQNDTGIHRIVAAILLCLLLVSYRNEVWQPKRFDSFQNHNNNNKKYKTPSTSVVGRRWKATVVLKKRRSCL